MNIHEYQAKQILKKFNVPVLRGEMAFSASEAEMIASKMKTNVIVVKSQIHAGGRGKGKFKEGSLSDMGGVRVCKSSSKVREHAEDMIGKTLITHQTGLAGKKVKGVYVEEGCEIENELYLAILIDRATGKTTFMASTEGGVNIEEVASNTPEKIFYQSVDPATGILPFHCRNIAFALGLSGKSFKSCGALIVSLYDAFCSTDSSLLEINPLVVTKNGDVLPLDAKMNFDTNALFRQSDILELRDEDEEDPMELEASKHDLNYIKLDGSIGCMVNGAGLAMSTMDIIKINGADPANFLDVGGGATKEKVTTAFKIILSDPNVQGILVNIFGGIMRCDVIAEGVVAAAKEVKLEVPLVVRLEGTNVDLGKKIMKESNLDIISAHDLADAAAKVVAAVEGA